MTDFDPASLLPALRQRQGWSQEQLAARLGVSFATVNRWEGGKSTPQRAQREAIAALAAELGLATDATASSPLGTPGSRPAFSVSDSDEIINHQSEIINAGPARPRRGLARSTVLGNKSMEQMLW
ncbi:MAG: helix-turn-helix transcriptional regulator, partial [Verrucomicrobia bacterium]|nr:helix-turn-helix transcriptional regulator [Verrucomicrobiota bacterium]